MVERIQLWYVRLAAAEPSIAGFYRICSRDEQQRANAFRFAKQRDHFLVGRSLLRIILGSYCATHPSQFTFRYGPKGKPFLVSAGEFPKNDLPLYFNVSHCDGSAVFAFSRNFDLGVDVERVRDLPDAEAIAKQFFSPYERAQLLSLDPSLRAEAFFNCWTRKEAYLKAIGNGLSSPLHEVEVSLFPGEPPVLRKLKDANVSQWSLLSLHPHPGHVGALAVPWPDCAVDCRRFDTAEACLEYLRQPRHIVD